MDDVTFTSNFWNWWVILLTVANILACWWLIVWTSKRRPGEAAVGDVMGHRWDGDLEEYNNPLPRWWLWLFYITILFSAVYLLLYPGLGTYGGLLNWSSVARYESEMQAAEERYGPIFAEYAARGIPDLARDPEAMQAGQRLFMTYCATCHGSDARGAPGFPNLRDGAWSWGGDPESIRTSILDGRRGVMPPWRDVLGEEGVEQVAAYVIRMSGREADPHLAEAGKSHFQNLCVACHGAQGEGNPMLGAPALNDNRWVHGGSPGAIRRSIAEGREGHMPAHRDFLGEDKAHLLATYVYSLNPPEER